MSRARLYPLIARRATAAVYRRSSRHEVARRHAHEMADASGMLAQPRLEDQLAVWLADSLPGPFAGVLGVRGVRACARAMALPLRFAGWLVGAGRVRGGGS